MAMSKAEAGRLGGKATVARHGTGHMSAIGKKGFAAIAREYGQINAIRWLGKRGGMAILPREQWSTDAVVITQWDKNDRRSFNG